MKITSFKSAGEFRAWLAKHHETALELWLGFFKKHTNKTGITYQEALDEALCHGWIDGIRKTIDESRFMIRFTRRRPKSIWSLVNVKRAGELTKLGRMKAPGLATFDGRDRKKSGTYSYENRKRPLDAAYEKQFRANAMAWDFFCAQPPWYQRTTQWWVMSAKKKETRLRRLVTLIEDCEKRRWVKGAVIAAKRSNKS